jgi:CheY-like chemotaxis protein
MENATRTAPAQVQSKSVLVVDDDGFSQELFREMLLAIGVSDIDTAGSGRIALRNLSALCRPPDILICDVFMPDMDGIEFLSELAKDGYQGGIILVSGLDASMLAIARDVALADGLRLLGAFAKPVPLDALEKAMALVDGAV